MKKGSVIRGVVGLLTGVIIFLLLLSGPAQAFSLSIEISDNKVTNGEIISFVTSLDIEDGRLPIDYLSLKISGPQNMTCNFYPDGTIISGCDEITIKPVKTANVSEGELKGSYEGSSYSWGYGYGYGDGYGYGILFERVLSYNISLNTSLVSEGVYSSKFEIKIGSDIFTKLGDDFYVIKPIIINDLASEPLCAYETDKIIVSANITGTVKDVIVETNYGNFTTTKEGTLYYSTINGIGGQNLSWRFVVKDLANDFVYGSWNNKYITDRTELLINPYLPDGLNNWYISEPEFALTNNDATQIYYGWEGSANMLYTGSFNLTDIPNPPAEIGGTLKLTYQANTSCGMEDKQTKMIYVDLTAPRLSNFIPSDKAIITNKNPSISVEISDVYGDNSGINKNSVSMKVDGTSVSRIINDISPMRVIAKYNANNLSEGEHVIEVSGEDNAGHKFYGNWSFTLNSSINFDLNVYSPENKYYNYNQVQFNVSTTNLVSRIDYIDNLVKTPRFKTLCINCKESKKSISFTNGPHNITIRAIDSFGNLKTKNVNFFVDNKIPQILSVYPKNRMYTNGSDLIVKYTEQNLKQVTLTYGNNQSIRNDCESGKNKECSFNLNLSEYDGRVIVYNFSLLDIAGNIKTKTSDVIVDTTSPIISNLNFSIKKNNVLFEMKILNEDIDSFDKTEYFDDFDGVKAKWKSLCTNLKKDNNNLCYERINLKRGNHNIKIRALDKAGNSYEKIVSIKIV